MADFSPYRRGTVVVDRAIQQALRETDAPPLAMAMVTMSAEDRQIVFRNMSRRAAALLAKDIEELEREAPGTFDRASALRQEEFLRKVERHHRLLEEDERLAPAELPRPSWAEEGELVRGLVALKRWVARNGAPSARPLLDGELHPLLRKGLELYVDEWDPAVVQSVLEQMRESLLVAERNRMDIMIEGIAALFGHDLPKVVEEKLAAFRLARDGHGRRGGD